MRHLILLNGPPGVGKSTIASKLGQALPQLSVVEVDAIKHSLPTWPSNPREAGLEARRSALDATGRLLAEGRGVVLGQYLARTEFIEELEAVAAGSGARFVEVILELDAPALAARLARRAEKPERPEHTINNELVGPGDADALVASIDALRVLRTQAHRVTADDLDSALAVIRDLLD